MCDSTQRHDSCMWYQSSIILRTCRCLSLRQIITKAHSLSFQTPTLSLGRATSLHETNRHRLLTRLMMRCAIQQQQICKSRHPSISITSIHHHNSTLWINLTTLHNKHHLFHFQQLSHNTKIFINQTHHFRNRQSTKYLEYSTPLQFNSSPVVLKILSFTNWS